jgi:hypothetical protein
MTETMMTDAERRAEIQRFELMCRNWISRHGRDRKLYHRFVKEVRDPRIKQALIEQRTVDLVDLHLNRDVKAGKTIRIDDQFFINTKDLVAQPSADQEAILIRIERRDPKYARRVRRILAANRPPA